METLSLVPEPVTLDHHLDINGYQKALEERQIAMDERQMDLLRIQKVDLFPVPSHPPPVPMERILASISHGLKPAPAGHVVEALVLQATLPVVHTTMWNMLCVLITTCHAHLIPYAHHITSLLMTALCSRDADQ